MVNKRGISTEERKDICAKKWKVKVSDTVHTGVFAYHVVTTSDDRKKFKMEVSTDWYVTVEYWRSSSIRVIFVDY